VVSAARQPPHAPSCPRTAGRVGAAATTLVRVGAVGWPGVGGWWRIGRRGGGRWLAPLGCAADSPLPHRLVDRVLRSGVRAGWGWRASAMRDTGRRPSGGRVGAGAGRRCWSPPSVTGSPAVAETGACQAGRGLLQPRSPHHGARQALRRWRWLHRRCAVRPPMLRPRASRARVCAVEMEGGQGAGAGEGAATPRGGGRQRGGAAVWRVWWDGCHEVEWQFRTRRGPVGLLLLSCFFFLRLFPRRPFWGGTLRGCSLRFAPSIRIYEPTGSRWRHDSNFNSHCEVPLRQVAKSGPTGIAKGHDSSSQVRRSGRDDPATCPPAGMSAVRRRQSSSVLFSSSHSFLRLCGPTRRTRK